MSSKKSSTKNLLLNMSLWAIRDALGFFLIFMGRSLLFLDSSFWVILMELSSQRSSHLLERLLFINELLNFIFLRDFLIAVLRLVSIIYAFSIVLYLEKFLGASGESSYCTSSYVFPAPSGVYETPEYLDDDTNELLIDDKFILYSSKSTFSCTPFLFLGL